MYYSAEHAIRELCEDYSDLFLGEGGVGEEESGEEDDSDEMGEDEMGEMSLEEYMQVMTGATGGRMEA